MISRTKTYMVQVSKRWNAKARERKPVSLAAMLKAAEEMYAPYLAPFPQIC